MCDAPFFVTSITKKLHLWEFFIYIYGNFILIFIGIL